MEKLIKFLLYSSILVILLDFGISRVLNKIYQLNKVGESGGVINYYLGSDTSSDLLVLGSSRAHRHVIPDSFNCKAFNLSHHGFRIPFTAGVLDILNQENKIPKIVLVHLELNSFCYHMKDDLKDSELRNLNFFYGENDFVTDQINKLSRGEKLKYLLASYKYNGKVPSLISNFIETKNLKDHNGFKGLKVNLSDSVRIQKQINIRNSLNFNPDVSEFKISNTGVKYLTHVVELFQERDVDLVFFSSPRFLKNTKSEELSRDFLKQFLNERNIPYLDYTNHKIPELEHKRFWRDLEHMNIDGATVFTARLIKDLQLLLDDSCLNEN